MRSNSRDHLGMLVRCGLAAALLTGTAVSAHQGYVKWVYVATEFARVLLEPSGVPVATVKRNVVLGVLETASGHLHIKVAGWVEEDALQVLSQPETSRPGIAIVRQEGASLRDAPFGRGTWGGGGVASVDLGKLHEETRVDILEMKHSYWRVRLSGWVAEDQVAPDGLSPDYELWNFRFRDVRLESREDSTSFRGVVKLIDGPQATYKMTLCLNSSEGARMAEEGFTVFLQHPGDEHEVMIPVGIPVDSIAAYQIVRGPGAIATVR